MRGRVTVRVRVMVRQDEGEVTCSRVKVRVRSVCGKRRGTGAEKRVGARNTNSCNFGITVDT